MWPPGHANDRVIWGWCAISVYNSGVGSTNARDWDTCSNIVHSGITCEGMNLGLVGIKLMSGRGFCWGWGCGLS